MNIKYEFITGEVQEVIVPDDLDLMILKLLRM